MGRFIYKSDEEDMWDSLMDAAENVGSGGSSDPASTITSDNGEVINLDGEPTNTK